MTTRSPRIRIHGAGSSPAAPTLLLSLVLVLALLPLGCSDDGGSPTAPAFAGGLSGTWAGSITGRPASSGASGPADLRLTLTVDAETRIQSGRYEITYSDGERESGDVAGAFNHEVYLNKDGETCSWQARFQTYDPQQLEGSWFGWTCGTEGGEVALRRQ